MRPPRGGHLDRNHDQVVDALTRAGIAVKSLAGAGDGLPDLLCAYRDVTVLLEVKDGTLPPSERKLKASQIEFFAKWPGKAYVVTTGEEAVRCVIDAAKPHADARHLEARLREELWHNHGCDFAGKYGDDGEMQCNTRGCLTDFKRMPLDELELRVMKTRRAALAKALEKREAAGGAFRMEGEPPPAGGQGPGYR